MEDELDEPEVGAVVTTGATGATVTVIGAVDVVESFDEIGAFEVTGGVGVPVGVLESVEESVDGAGVAVAINPADPLPPEEDVADVVPAVASDAVEVVGATDGAAAAAPLAVALKFFCRITASSIFTVKS